ncbi:MAG: 8-oxo-dGTP diphosphatase [Halobacteriales archaeon]|jgi:8-oxo-dGTP diphosphatase
MFLSVPDESVFVGVHERSRRRVATALERLESTYGPFEVKEDRHEVVAQRYEAIRERFEAGSIGYAGVWVTNRMGEVLLIDEAGRDGWSEPTGKHRPDERLAETALREVREETGVECEITGVALAHVVEMVDAESPARPPVVQLVLAFAGTHLEGTPEPGEENIRQARWWSDHPKTLVFEGLRSIEIPASRDEVS